MSKWRKTIWNVSTTAMESHTQQQAERTSDGREEPEEDKVKSLKRKSLSGRQGMKRTKFPSTGWEGHENQLVQSVHLAALPSETQQHQWREETKKMTGPLVRKFLRRWLKAHVVGCRSKEKGKHYLPEGKQTSAQNRLTLQRPAEERHLSPSAEPEAVRKGMILEMKVRSSYTSREDHHRHRQTAKGKVMKEKSMWNKV